MKLSDLAKNAKAEYVSTVVDGANVTHKAGMVLNGDVDVPKGKGYSYKTKGGQWKADKV